MAVRMGKLRRAIALVHLLSESSEGLTLDEMAAGGRITAPTFGVGLRLALDR